MNEIVLIVVLVLMRRQVKRNNLDPQWARWLLWGIIAAALFTGVPALTAHSSLRGLPFWIEHGALILVAYIMYRVPGFERLRNLVFAILPLIVVGVLRDFFSIFGSSVFRTVDEYLNYADPFIFIWMVTMFWVNNRQQKAMDREKKKREEEERLNRITLAQNQQLETMVAERTAELTSQKEELEHALTDLRSTQDQLIQAEKMASLGELTAGIAHEIQNPLNFVNNFSEVNMELVDELNTALQKGDPQEALAIAQDIKANLSKITHHGKRADGIVKGMLLHSQSNTGQKVETDINQLAEEYLGLSYHGLRAKDKSFNATLQKHLDPKTGKALINPSDMGRVLLNILNNSFYAVNEKKKQHVSGYEPTVSISTRREPHRVEIIIRDNGNGISEKVKEKIFQPFFTTKPTGQGTGLGLSISFDIVTKGHGGTLQVQSEEGKYTAFIIHLPV